MISFKIKENDRTISFLKRLKKINYRPILEKYAREGLSILREATPKDSGLTSEAWRSTIVTDNSGFKISWTNSNIEDGVPIVILLQYGHATRSGSYVQGKDFINPAMKPLFDRLLDDLWKEVTNL